MEFVVVFPVKQTQSESPCLNGFQSDGDERSPLGIHVQVITINAKRDLFVDKGAKHG